MRKNTRIIAIAMFAIVVLAILIGGAIEWRSERRAERIAGIEARMEKAIGRYDLAYADSARDSLAAIEAGRVAWMDSLIAAARMVDDLRKRADSALADGDWERAQGIVDRIVATDAGAAGDLPRRIDAARAADRRATMAATGALSREVRHGIDFEDARDLDLFMTAPSSGTFAVAGGAFRMASEVAGAITMAWLPGVRFANGTIEVTTDLATGPANMDYGLLFRGRNTAGGYTMYGFGISSNGHYIVSEWHEGKLTTLRNWTRALHWFRREGRNRLKVICLDDSIVLYLNGRAVEHLRDGSLASGWVGLYASPGLTVAFDNLTIVPEINY